MVQSAESLTRNDATGTCGGDSPRRRSLPQSEMGSTLVVVADVLRKQPPQMSLVHSNHVIQQILPTVFYPTLGDPVLPRALKRSLDWSDSQRSNRSGNFKTILPIPVKEQESGSRSEWKCLAQLLNYPKARGVFRRVEVQNPPTIVGDYEEAVDDTERDGRDSEEVHCSDRLTMVVQERKPTLRWLRVSWCSFHPTGNRSFRNVETEHEQLAVNARRSPGRILENHSQDQFPNLFGSRLPSNGSSNPRYQPPVHSEADPVPAYDGFRCHNDQRLLPSWPESMDSNPEKLVNGVEVRTRASSLQDGKLLAKS